MESSSVHTAVSNLRQMFADQGVDVSGVSDTVLAAIVLATAPAIQDALATPIGEIGRLSDAMRRAIKVGVLSEDTASVVYMAQARKTPKNIRVACERAGIPWNPAHRWPA